MSVKIIEKRELKKLSISGLQSTNKEILAQIDKNIKNAINNHEKKKNTEELLSMVRSVEGQVSDLISRLENYRSILHTYNKSDHSDKDIENLYKYLK